MTSFPFRLARRGLIAIGAVAALLGSVGFDTHSHASPAASAEQIAAVREVRIRKLHLVRPDLINYPIAFDSLC